MTLIGVPSSTASSSIIGRSVGSDTTMTRVLPVAAVRDEPVPQHQVRRDGAEQIVVDRELRDVDVLEPVALGEPARLRGFGRLLGVGRLGRRRRKDLPACR